MNGKTIDNAMATAIMIMLVLLNWEIPKNVATVFGKAVTVVTMVK
jgi:hypothetical protein